MSLTQQQQQQLPGDLLNYVSDFLLTHEWIAWSLTEKELYRIFHLQLLKDKMYRRKIYFKLSKYWRKYFDAYCYSVYISSTVTTTTTMTTSMTATTTTSANVSDYSEIPIYGVTFSYGRYQNLTKRDLKQWLHFFIHFNHSNYLSYTNTNTNTNTNANTLACTDAASYSFLLREEEEDKDKEEEGEEKKNGLHKNSNNNNKKKKKKKNSYMLNPIGVLNMDHNKEELNTYGVQWLGYLLQFSSTMSYLQVLQLHDCNLNDASIEILCNSLSARKDASSLRQMYLSANAISSASMRYFLDRNKVQNKLPKLTLLDLSDTNVDNDTCQMIYQWYNNHNNNHHHHHHQQHDTITAGNRKNTNANANGIGIESIYLRDCSLITEIGIEMLNRIKSIIDDGKTIQNIPTVYLHNSGCREFDQEWFTNPSLVFRA